MRYKALHLELLTDLTAEHFLQALQRTMALRGNITTIYSDRGTNFIGGKNVLEIAKKQLSVTASSPLFRFEWVLSPPHAPWFTGLVEVHIRAVKRALKALLLTQKVSDDKMRTSLAVIANVINNRPLTYVDQAHELRPVRPADFLGINGVLPMIPDPPSQKSLTNDFFALQRFISGWWKRYLREYVPMLHKRAKWTREEAELKIDDVVVVLDEKFNQGSYPLGRVTRVFPSKDGRIRKVEILCQGKLLLRPVAGLSLLEIHV